MSGLNREMQSAAVVVVGGGVIGSSCAYRLARAGLKVIQVERSRPAAGASGASAGGVRQQARDPRELPLAVYSIGLWTDLEAELESDIEYLRSGHITLIEREEELSSLQLRVEQERQLGLEIRVVSNQELRELVPALSPTVVAGSFCPTDGHANPTLTTQAFASAAQRAGAKLWRRTRLTGIKVRGGRIAGVQTSRGTVACDWVVNTAGAWAGRVAAMVGVELPISARALQMIQTEPMPPLLTPVLGSMRRALSLKQIPNGTFLIGGGWPGRPHLDRFRATTLRTSLEASPRDAIAVLPALAGARLQCWWAGLEAFTPDDLPVIDGESGPEGLVTAAGFSGHGFALAPAVGAAVERLITGAPAPVDLSPFRSNRFAASLSDMQTHQEVDLVVRGSAG